MTQTLELIPFKAEHLEHILSVGLKDEKITPFILPSHGASIEKMGGYFTITEDQVPLVIGGIKPFWKGRAEAWLLFSKYKTKKFMSLISLINKVIDDSPIKRIEMIIDSDFCEGARWAKILGFKLEAPLLKSYLPTGHDASLYAKVRE